MASTPYAGFSTCWRLLRCGGAERAPGRLAAGPGLGDHQLRTPLHRDETVATLFWRTCASLNAQADPGAGALWGRVARGLLAAVPRIQAPTDFELTTPLLSPSPSNSDILGKNLERSNHVNLRIFSPGSDDRHRELKFDSAQKGLFTASSPGQHGFPLPGMPDLIPYHPIALDHSAREETQGYAVVFNHERQLITHLAKTGKPWPTPRSASTGSRSRHCNRTPRRRRYPQCCSDPGSVGFVS